MVKRGDDTGWPDDHHRDPPPRTIQEREALHTSGVYAKRDITLVRGQGAWLWDDQDRRYIDCTGGYGSANVGHATPPCRPR